MSEFHGGFLVRGLTGSLQGRVVEASKAYLDRQRVARRDLSLIFATRASAPVVLVAVRGGDADGKEFCYWHHHHAAMGGEIAMATALDVWAYCYENQVGFEMVAHFDAKGREKQRSEADWDRFFGEGGFEDSEGGHRQFMHALPLGQLAAMLKVPRSLLDIDLAYDTPSCTVSLFGTAEPNALANYLAGPLAPMPEPPRSDEGATISVYLTDTMAREVQQQAKRLQTSLGTVIWAAWECGKTALYADTTGYDENLNEAPPMAAPPAVLPDEIAIPQQATQTAELVEGDGKVKVSLALPERVVEEIQVLARFADRSMSWLIQSAYARSRHKIIAAERASH